MKKAVSLLISLVFIIAMIGLIKNSDNDYALKFQMENNNFIFYSCNKDKKCLDHLSSIINKERKQV